MTKTLLMNGDTIVAGSDIENGQRTYKIYRSKIRQYR